MLRIFLVMSVLLLLDATAAGMKPLWGGQIAPMFSMLGLVFFPLLERNHITFFVPVSALLGLVGDVLHALPLGTLMLAFASLSLWIEQQRDLLHVLPLPQVFIRLLTAFLFLHLGLYFWVWLLRDEPLALYPLFEQLLLNGLLLACLMPVFNLFHR